MFCPNCGKEILDKQKFCEHCGEEVSEEITIVENVAEFLTSDNEENNIQNTENYNFTWLWTLITIVIIVFLLTIIILFYHPKTENNLNKENTSITLEEVFVPANKLEEYFIKPDSIPYLTNQYSLKDVTKNLKEVQDFLKLMFEYYPDQKQNEEYFLLYLNALLQFKIYNQRNVLNYDFSICKDIYRTSDAIECGNKYKSELKPVGLETGFDLYYGVYLKEDKTYTYNTYGKYLPKDWQEFLRIRALHSQQAFFDNYANVTYEELNSRIHDYETFKEKYPDFIDIETVDNYLYEAFYTYVYDKGKYNFYEEDSEDSDILELKPEYTNAVQNYINLYPKSKLITVFKALFNNDYHEAEQQYPYKEFDEFVEEKEVSKNIHLSFNFRETYDWYIYSQNNKIWKMQKGYRPLKNNEIALFHVPPMGSSGLSEFLILNNNKKVTGSIASGIYTSFLRNSKLYIQDLKTYYISEVKYNNGFKIVQLTADEIRELYPNVEIIKLSDFRNRDYTIYLGLKPKKYFLIDDIDGGHSRYSLTSPTATFYDKEIFNLFQPEKEGLIKYSRYETCTSETPCYYIHVKGIFDMLKK